MTPESGEGYLIVTLKIFTPKLRQNCGSENPNFCLFSVQKMCLRNIWMVSKPYGQNSSCLNQQMAPWWRNFGVKILVKLLQNSPAAHTFHIMHNWRFISMTTLVKQYLSHSRFGHYFYSNLYGRWTCSQGCQKIVGDATTQKYQKQTLN
jgi:hypothetical protein